MNSSNCNSKSESLIHQGNEINNSATNLKISPQMQQQTLKQRINSLLIKTLAENTEKDRNLQNATMGETVTSRISQPVKIIVNLKDSLQILQEISYTKKQFTNGQVVVALDCEGINVGPKGKLTLIQIGTMTNQIYVFDLITCPNIMTTGGLQKFLESKNITKVCLNYLLEILQINS